MTIQMTTPTNIDLVGAYCRVHGKYGVCVYLDWDLEGTAAQDVHNTEALLNDLPLWRDYWATAHHVVMTAINDNMVVFLTDTKEEHWQVYNQIRGDDGLPNDPTPGNLYCITFGPDGEWITENT
jgi:hypothetical protein